MPDPMTHTCVWEWDGIAWQLVLSSGCSIEERCDPPAQAGTFIGMSAETECIASQNDH